MRQWRVGTFSMGIFLVILGCIMLTSQIRGLTSLDLIFKWWPAILIMLGVEILIYVGLSKQDDPKIKFDVFSILIISFIIISSIGIYAVTSLLSCAEGDISLFPGNSVKFEITNKNVDIMLR